jgi:hypothetical protein
VAAAERVLEPDVDKDRLGERDGVADTGRLANWETDSDSGHAASSAFVSVGDGVFVTPCEADDVTMAVLEDVPDGKAVPDGDGSQAITGCTMQRRNKNFAKLRLRLLLWRLYRSLVRPWTRGCQPCRRRHSDYRLLVTQIKLHTTWYMLFFTKILKESRTFHGQSRFHVARGTARFCVFCSLWGLDTTRTSSRTSPAIGMSLPILPDQVLSLLKFDTPRITPDAKYGELADLWRNEAKNSVKDAGFGDVLSLCRRGPSEEGHGTASGPALSESFLDMLHACIVPGFLPWSSVLNGLRTAALAVAKESVRPAAGLVAAPGLLGSKQSESKSMSTLKLSASVELSIVAVFQTVRALVAKHPDDCVPVIEALRGILGSFRLQVRFHCNDYVFR